MIPSSLIFRASLPTPTESKGPVNDRSWGTKIPPELSGSHLTKAAGRGRFWERWYHNTGRREMGGKDKVNVLQLPILRFRGLDDDLNIKGGHRDILKRDEGRVNREKFTSARAYGGNGVTRCDLVKGVSRDSYWEVREFGHLVQGMQV